MTRKNTKTTLGKRTGILSIAISNMTAFKEFELEVGSGVNVFMGSNGSGKTHLLKAMYFMTEGALASRGKSEEFFIRLFRPYEGDPRRLMRRRSANKLSLRIRHDVGALLEDNPSQIEWELEANRDAKTHEWTGTGNRITEARGLFFPAKNIMAELPGFKSLYETREIAFDQTYADIVTKLFLPPLREKESPILLAVLPMIRKVIDGDVEQKGETFFLKSGEGESSRVLEMSLVPEGFRKFAMLWVLLRNGSIAPGTILFWDEPESNLNPILRHTLAEILMTLQRHGVQVFLASHDYLLLKELELARQESDSLRFHTLSQPASNAPVQATTSESFVMSEPNLILEAYNNLLEKGAQKALGKARNGS